ncbi:Succinate dehydrogenase assembly factor 2, mitochondrial [Zostera marina]|uniref:Succinate dehydrogenase assembly factor 2, mitochondrial n=1 Tax=Zostera marina TaxID=29655 RepID=A0A0K9NU29_ZOSMR|nr:Succinate dehydrogenase assembly factor 2, mitochondrial [Zostera marina]
MSWPSTLVRQVGLLRRVSRNLTLKPLLIIPGSSINNRYIKFSPCSSGSFNTEVSNEERKRRLLNRLLYRSRQRGFLELDLVLGKWVEENICSMDEHRIKALVDVLDLENPDLWKWLTGQEEPPNSINTNPVFSAVRTKVMDNLNNADPKTRASPGQPWVRGWDDKSKSDGTVYGNQ